MFNKQKGNALVVLLYFIFWLAMAGGYVANIVKVIQEIAHDSASMPWIVFRIIGALTGYGCILGYF